MSVSDSVFPFIIHLSSCVGYTVHSVNVYISEYRQVESRERERERVREERERDKEIESAEKERERRRVEDSELCIE